MGLGVKPEANLTWNKEHTLFWKMFVFFFSQSAWCGEGWGEKIQKVRECGLVYSSNHLLQEEDSIFFPFTC